MPARMKILIVKLGAIGDIVHTLPALAAVRSALPDAELSWVVEKRSAEILRGNRAIDHLIEIDTRSLRRERAVAGLLHRFRQQVHPLRGSKFEIAIDFQGLLKSAVIAKLSGAKKRYGFSRPALREPASRILLTDGIDIPERTHVVRKNLILAAAALQIPLPETRFEFPVFTGKSHVLEAEGVASRAGGSFAILNPAGGWVTKLWPAANFGALADLLWERFGLISVITAGPREEEIAAAVAAASLTGKAITARPSLKGFFELAKRARVYIGGDTGPTHLAVAAGTPVVGIFGPTEWWRNGSTDHRDICVERTDIACRINCHRRTCSKWICMDIGVEAVFSAVEKRIGHDSAYIMHL